MSHILGIFPILLLSYKISYKMLTFRDTAKRIPLCSPCPPPPLSGKEEEWLIRLWDGKRLIFYATVFYQEYERSVTVPMCPALLPSFKYQGWVFCSLLQMVGKMTWEDSFLGWICTQFNLWINYWANFGVNWLLVAFSNPAQPAIKRILIANLKPDYFSIGA